MAESSACDNRRVKYWPNPAHKVETTEAGPPEWHPGKDPCPPDMTVDERTALLDCSIACDPDDPIARRWTMRRSQDGLEFFDIKWTGGLDGENIFHGHPASYVPAVILRTFRDLGHISQAEYRQLIKSFAVPRRK